MTFPTQGPGIATQVPGDFLVGGDLTVLGSISGALSTSATSHTTDFAATSGYHDNVGASGTIAGTLPSTPGAIVAVARVDNFEVRIKPASGKQILWSGGRMAVDEYLSIQSEVGVLYCIVNADGDVQVFSEFGDIQEETP